MCTIPDLQNHFFQKNVKSMLFGESISVNAVLKILYNAKIQRLIQYLYSQCHIHTIHIQALTVLSGLYLDFPHHHFLSSSTKILIWQYIYIHTYILVHLYMNTNIYTLGIYIFTGTNYKFNTNPIEWEFIFLKLSINEDEAFQKLKIKGAWIIL